MPARTKKGVHAKEHILGLKRYLSVAEKERLKFHNAPEKNPTHFDHLLPYAMALGVEEDWADQFEDLHRKPPSWYDDGQGGVFNAIVFTRAINNFSSAANTNLTSKPSSASSGFSGGGS